MVSIPEPEERARLGVLGRRLGVEDPLVDGRLRHVDAGCVFQDSEGRCRPHLAFGPESKPAACRQFPLVVVETEGGRRAGVDPCCYHAHLEDPAAPALPDTLLPARDVLFEPDQARLERELLAALGGRGASVGGMLSVMRGGEGPGSVTLPAGLAGGWIRCLHGARLERFLEPSIAGASLRSALGPAFGSIEQLDERAPPPWRGLAQATEAQVLGALRALVFLRVCSGSIPMVQAVVGLGLLGAVLVGWQDEDAEKIGLGLAGWFRLMRAPSFSGTLLSGLRRG